MTDHPESIVEQALAHQIGDETIRAYRRGDAFLKRRALMKDWEAYLVKLDAARPSSAAHSGAQLQDVLTTMIAETGMVGNSARIEIDDDDAGR